MAETNDTKEIWKPVAGWEDLCEVSSLGRVKSLPREAAGGHGMRSLPARLRRPAANNHGYLIVIFQHGDRMAWPLVHRLVYETFIGPIPVGCEINHIDGNKLNNAVENLEAITHSANMAHAKANGFMLSGDQHPAHRHPECILRGAAQPTSKLSASDVEAIRRLHANGSANGTELAARYGVSQATISNIVRGKTWRQLGLDVTK